MKAYIAVRQECEALILAGGLTSTILRPWYVLGPGHRWPYILIPFYKICERMPATVASAKRLGLLTLSQMTTALLHAVEHPPHSGIKILEVPKIRQLSRRTGNVSRPAEIINI